MAFVAQKQKSKHHYYPVLTRLRKKAVKSLLIVAIALSAPAISFAETTVVAVLGDSLTKGFGLRKQKGFVPVLQNWLTERGEDVLLINEGRSGRTTTGGLTRIQGALTPNIDALIIELGGNDMLRKVEPSIIRNNLSRMIKIAKSRNIPVLLVGVKANKKYPAEFEASFNRIYPDLAKEFDILLYPNFFATLYKDQEQTRINYRFMLLDRIHPNSRGVVKVVNDIGPLVQKLIARSKSKK